MKKITMLFIGFAWAFNITSCRSVRTMPVDHFVLFHISEHGDTTIFHTDKIEQRVTRIHIYCMSEDDTVIFDTGKIKVLDTDSLKRFKLDDPKRFPKEKN